MGPWSDFDEFYIKMTRFDLSFLSEHKIKHE